MQMEAESGNFMAIGTAVVFDEGKYFGTLWQDFFAVNSISQFYFLNLFYASVQSSMFIC